MIEVKNVTKKIGDKVILKNISFNVEDGQFITVLGPNGAGKSTLFKILSLLMKPTSGVIKINGIAVNEGGVALRKKLGVISHNSFLYDSLSARDNLLFYGKMYGVKNLEERVREVIQQVGLELSFYQQVKTFSRGMLQRLAIARCLLNDPEIVLFDEPYTGLDQQAIDILNNVLKTLKQRKRTILMITHNFEEGVELSDRILILNRGQLVFDEANLYDLKSLKEIYRKKVGISA
ncbi:ABC transporter ATP-binding protein [Carboxydothermus hydrogenoformans]|uniref:Sodium ABC transporter, ATP-binding protein n=1 Tax=Carboxydothermus hydrogenoformans (strain ATCC BAA-161 / DSM 6008 / Z-2901) TaxID=246194 RepID=Q3ACB8_CARHZ|nr:ABC transporter ATP-binding protein [Carboxydothermus hydrogenoformans]ABB14316.1 sodium ABC transporter, ATP-binding protein [Carboxydothermus hydrogenoformans Z-2901]